MALRKSARFPSVGWEGSSTREEREGSENGWQGGDEGSRVPCCAFLCWFLNLSTFVTNWSPLGGCGKSLGKGQERRLAKPGLTEL